MIIVSFVLIPFDGQAATRFGFVVEAREIL